VKQDRPNTREESKGKEIIAQLKKMFGVMYLFGKI
jgi:hypothetical protein